MGSSMADGPGEKRPALSLVVLCYRSGDRARDFVRKTLAILEEGGVEDFELILVGNYVEGTDDPTPEVVRSLAQSDPRIRCRAQPKRGWMGWDMRSGLELARGEVLGVIDGDGQVPVSDVPKLYRLLTQEGYDLTKSFRITRGDGLKRRILSGVYNGLFHVLFPGTLARDVNAKPKLLARSAYEKLDLRSNGWFIDAEIMIQARRHGFRIGELPTGFLGLTGRRSFVRVGAVLEFVWNLFCYRILEFRQPRGGTR